MTDSDYAGLLEAWNIDFTAVETDFVIGGSPERSVFRTVVRDTSGDLWVLERIEEANLERKCEVAETLDNLSSQIDRIPAWRRTGSNLFFQTFEKRIWMLRPYVEGVPLDRETWLDDDWRMDAMGDFLVQLKEYDGHPSEDFFSIAEYATERMIAWRRNFPVLAQTLEPFFKSLNKTFFSIHDSLPMAFCHGDFHPLNVVWGDQRIRSVIDWEFCGIKPELYDVALLLGCAGFDDPDNLISKPAVRLIGRLQSAGFGMPQSWECLIGLTASIRFGWMSEWIRRQDDEAAEMEAVYLGILVDQADYISKTWMTRVP